MRRCDSGACVVVELDGDRVLVRDEHGAVIELCLDAWGWALDAVRAGGLPPHARRLPGRDGGVVWRGAPPSTGAATVTLRYTQVEWDAFAAGVEAGRFDVEGLAAEVVDAYPDGPARRVPPVPDTARKVSDEAVVAYRTAARAAMDASMGTGSIRAYESIHAGLVAAYLFLAAQAQERAEKAERERDSLVRRLGVRFGELEEARAELRQMRDERDREPTGARSTAAQAALIAAWPDLAADPVHVEQLAAVALNAAYNPAWRDGLYAGLRPEGGGSDA